MVANVMLIVEREFDYPQKRVFRAWTAPEEMMLWRGSPGWHVEQETVSSELRLGGKHHHVKIRDNDPSVRVTTDAVFTEYFDPDVFVAKQRITGDPGITRTSPWNFASNSPNTVATAAGPWCASCRDPTSPPAPNTTPPAGSGS